MPPKRNKGRRNMLKLTHNQKKKIESRLMAISLEIDDYLYQQKLMPIGDVEAYIREVEGYKALCTENDVRTLQVIEKITRFMNAIIKEQEGTTRSPSYSTQTNCPSPVYSLPDDDKIMLSEGPINGTSREEIYKGNIQETETIDLCDNDDAVVHEKVQVEVEIHRAMSGLSITEEDPNEPNNSQSILDSFELNTNVHENDKIDNTVNGLRRNNSSSRDINKGNKIQIISNKKIVGVLPNNPQRNIMPNSSSEQNKHKGILKNADNNKSNVLFKKPDILRNYNVEKTKRARTVNKSHVNTKNNKNTHKKCTEMNKKDNRKVLKKNTNKNANIIDLTDDKKVDRSKNCYTNNNNVEKVNKTNEHVLKTNPVTVKGVNETKVDTLKPNIEATQNYIQVPLANLTGFTHITNSTECAVIYNTSVANDLSWIENIRYVREISNEETDKKIINLEDTFWNNCEFPSDWNDTDFDY